MFNEIKIKHFVPVLYVGILAQYYEIKNSCTLVYCKKKYLFIFFLGDHDVNYL